MASLQGLPPLPKSLSGLLNFSSSQWKELERLHAMRTMIQQDLSRSSSSLERNIPPPVPPHQNKIESDTAQLVAESTMLMSDDSFSSGMSAERRPSSAKSRLDAQLSLLRKEMVGLRQLDMSLLCQLWSLNESIQEYKHLMQERAGAAASASSPGWDSGLLLDYSDDSYTSPRTPFQLDRPRSRRSRRQRGDLCSVPERELSTDSSSSHSSFEFGDI